MIKFFKKKSFHNIYDFAIVMLNSFQHLINGKTLKQVQGDIRYVSAILLTLLLFVSPSFSAIKGGIGYQIPIDYSTLNAVEMAEKADYYFNTIMLLDTNGVDENMTSALNLYTMLENKCPENTLYPIRLGILYDRIRKDRYAKGSFYRAIGINKNIPEPYFYLGEFFFKRQNYKRALKMYLEAYNKGFNTHTQTLNRLNQIYTMFGDLKNAERYTVNPS